MFKRKQKGSSASTRVQPKSRAVLQRQVEERLGYWRLFLEAKQLELEERRAAGDFVPSEVTMEARATTPTPEPKLPGEHPTPAAEETFF